MTIGDIITEARTNVGDLDSSAYKWTAQQFEAALQAFFTQVGGSNAEALCDARGLTAAIPDGLVSADVFPWDSIYRQPAVNFLCWKYYSGDSEDTRDQGLAEKYRGLFNAFFVPAKDI